MRGDEPRRVSARSGRELAQHVVQDAAVAEVFELVGVSMRQVRLTCFSEPSANLISAVSSWRS